jgi:hypothetical protein
MLTIARIESAPRSWRAGEFAFRESLWDSESSVDHRSQFQEGSTGGVSTACAARLGW